MNVIEKYEKEFNEIVDAVYRISHKRPLYKTTNKFVNHLFSLISKEKYLVKTNLDKRDIYQELALLWLEWHKKYLTQKYKAGLKNYLMRRSIWEMRDWLRKQMRSHSGTTFIRPPIHRTKLFTLHWLVRGDRENGILQMLSAYDRYLIYLYWVCEYSFKKIAKIVGKSPVTVRRNILNIKRCIRSYSNAQDNTSRSCN